jgi:hypothetical protein
MERYVVSTKILALLVKLQQIQDYLVYVHQEEIVVHQELMA